MMLSLLLFTFLGYSMKFSFYFTLKLRKSNNILHPCENSFAISLFFSLFSSSSINHALLYTLCFTYAMHTTITLPAKSNPHVHAFLLMNVFTIFSLPFVRVCALSFAQNFDKHFYLFFLLIQANVVLGMLSSLSKCF